MVRERSVGEVLHLGAIAPTGRSEVEQVAPARAAEAVDRDDVGDRNDREGCDGKERRCRPHAEEREGDADERGRREQRQRGPRGSEQARLVGSLPGPEGGDGSEPDEERDVGATRDQVLLDHERGGDQRRGNAEPACDPEDAAVERIAERPVDDQRPGDRPRECGGGGDLERQARPGSARAPDSIGEAEDDEEASPLADPVSARERVQPCRVPAREPEVVVPGPEERGERDVEPRGLPRVVGERDRGTGCETAQIGQGRAARENARSRGEADEREQARRLGEDRGAGADRRERDGESRGQPRPEHERRGRGRGGDGDVRHPGCDERREDARRERDEHGERREEGPRRAILRQPAREEPDADDEHHTERRGEHAAEPHLVDDAPDEALRHVEERSAHLQRVGVRPEISRLGDRPRPRSERERVPEAVRHHRCRKGGREREERRHRNREYRGGSRDPAGERHRGGR